MKKIISILIFFIIITGLSCKKDFIELIPIDKPTADLLFKTDNDFNNAIVGVYAALRDAYRNMYTFSDIRGDDAWKEVIREVPDYHSDKFIMTSESGVLSSVWEDYFQAIYRIKFLLAKLEEADPTKVTKKDSYTIEAKFLRALVYFDLVRIFGDVPLVTKPLSIQESYEYGRENVDKVYNEIIIPDLVAAEGLSAKYTGSDVGRPTKGAAKALLGKVYLTRKDFAKAETKLQEVTSLGYSLLGNYNDLFDYTKNEHHSEYIFDIEYEKGDLGMGSPWTSSFLPMSPEFSTFLGVAGVGGETFNPTMNIARAFDDPNDKRFYVTVDTLGGFYDKTGKFVKFIQAATYTRKYIVPISISSDSPANWKYIRYADVLLMYAEALNENNKTDDALTYLNMVRTRAGVGTFSGLTKDETRDKIYLERRLELSFEGHRWFDLVRTGTALSTMTSQGMKNYMTVFPVPLSQIQVMNNPALFPQNPGYE